jgi:hypothetical protein
LMAPPRGSTVGSDPFFRPLWPHLSLPGSPVGTSGCRPRLLCFIYTPVLSAGAQPSDIALTSNLLDRNTFSGKAPPKREPCALSLPTVTPTVPQFQHQCIPSLLISSLESLNIAPSSTSHLRHCPANSNSSQDLLISQVTSLTPFHFPTNPAPGPLHISSTEGSDCS